MPPDPASFSEHEEAVLSTRHTQQVARVLGVTTSAVVRAARSNDLPGLERYLSVHPDITPPFLLVAAVFHGRYGSLGSLDNTLARQENRGCCRKFREPCYADQHTH